jgi:hypothetical protein
VWTVTENLASVVKRAYQVFDVDRPSSLLVSTTRDLGVDCENLLLSKEQHDIPSDAVEQWLSAEWVVGYVDDEKVVKWMMPRILELLSIGHHFLAASRPLYRLGVSGFPRRYKSDEVKLVNNFLIEYAVALVEYPEALNRVMMLDDALEMAAGANIEINPILDRVGRCPDEAVVEGLLDSLGGSQPSDWLDPNRYIPDKVMYGSGGFRSAYKTIHQWYTSDDMLLRLLTYAEGSCGTSSQRQIAWEAAEAILAISSTDGLTGRSFDGV